MRRWCELQRSENRGHGVWAGPTGVAEWDEEGKRAVDRTRVRRARESRRPLLLLFLLIGPGVLVMLGENDGPSMLSYSMTGATYGIGFFVPFIILTFVMAYIVQEATVRIGIATHRGHAELIYQRFGPFWGNFSMLDLSVGNVLTLITEFVAIRAGTAYFGIPAWIAVASAVVFSGAVLLSGRYFAWERIVLLLATANLLFIPAAFFSHPDAAALSRALGTWGPLPGGANGAFLTLLLANIGATVTPWMIFFQQSATVDKGLTRIDLPQGRVDTALGTALATIAAIAAIMACAPLFTHHVNVASLSNSADFATALRPYLGTTGVTLFALGMVEAGLVATMTISTSSSYAVGEVLRRGHSLNLTLRQEPAFYAINLASIVLAAAVVLIPNAPLLAITITVNVIATLLMAPALLFVLLLVNDREIMGNLANSPMANLAGGAVMVAIAAVGAVYGITTVFPRLLPK
jgi:Mn2+/Fe2+ NRAMP family transporter